jgi:hypothetical protein
MVASPPANTDTVAAGWPDELPQRQLLQLKAIGQALLILKEKEIEKAIEIGALQEVL